MKTGMSTYKFGSPVAVKPSAPPSVEQVKTFATSYVEQCWKDYAKLYPEAFAARGKLAKTTPELVFVPTQAEFDKAFGSRTDTENMIGFVQRDDPSRVYVHTANLVKHANKLGPNYVKSTMSHELIHNLSHPVVMRIANDMKGPYASCPGVQKDLALTFNFDRIKAPGIKEAFSVRELIMEFGAEHFASEATGLSSYSVAYAPVRATGDKLLKIVGEDVFRKAVLGNDPVAYRKVVEAAKALQGQNARTNIADQADKAVVGCRAAQAAVPFGTSLTAATLEKVDARYWSESALYDTLKQHFPDQIKNFDFRLLNAVDALLKRQGASPDFREESRGAMTAAYRAAWPSLK